jgi:hypothetical protein
MALSLSDALSQYGFVGDLANSIPELKGIFAQAAREEWDPAAFQRAVMDSRWWKTSSEAARTLATQSVTDPATYKQTIKNAATKVDLLMKQMGLAPQSSARLSQMANHFLVNNYDDETIRRWLALNVGPKIGPEGALSGQAADLDAHLRQVASSYGVPFSDSTMNHELMMIMRGERTLESWESLMRERAKAAHPHLAAELDSGMTLRDIADPYIATMANTLEVAETNLDLTDLHVKRALNDDPRWDKTKQARTAAYETVAQVGRDFGFEGGAS